MSEEERAEAGPLSPESAEAERDYVYKQVSEFDFSLSTKEPYTAEDLFEKEKFELSGSELKTIFDILSYNESATSKRLGALADTPEGHQQIIDALRSEKDRQETIYQGTVEDSDALTYYTYPDILTDSTRYKGQRIKQCIFAELLADSKEDEISPQLAEEIEVYAEMTEEPVSSELISSILEAEYGVLLADPLVPQSLRDTLEALISDAEIIEE